MGLYDKSRAKYDQKLFASPTNEYRGAPFWSWNNRLDKQQLLRQLDVFEGMGIGGATIHCRTGLNTPYMGKEFLDIVKACTERANKKGMLTWLYDEDRWPSGFAGGLVTKEKKYRLRHLLFTQRPYGGKADAKFVISGAATTRYENGKLIAAYDVRLNADGTLAGFERISPKDAKGKAAKGATRWYAYVEVAEPTSWFNFQTYADTLNPKAIERFIETTHEPYKKTVGKYFGKSVPAIFTDEPQFARKTVLGDAFSVRDAIMPWTDDFAATFEAAYGADILDDLPEVFWLLPDGLPSVARYRMHDHVAERFAAAFADTLGEWCEKNKIALTGHMMEEPTLSSQTHALGEAMRSYRSFHLPGVDMLCDWREYTTAKQTQSAVHQYGREGMLSELYGVTGWHFDFVGHKGQGDWQAALGVTIRVHHLSWVSMAGEAKRDYPASIFYQSPWWREYRTVEDHFARVNVALTRGKPVVRVGVVHPIESFWLAYGPDKETELERNLQETRFADLTKWLLFGNIDFNFVAESLLPTQSPHIVTENEQVRLGVGQMAYEVVLVPGMRTIRSSTLDALEQFADAGGRVIFVGEVPAFVDAEVSDRAQRLAARSGRIEFSRPTLLETLDDVRDVQIEPGPAGWWTHANNDPQAFLYQLRDDGEQRFLFICNTDRQTARWGAKVRITGHYQLTEMDTLTGEERPLAATYTKTHTELAWPCAACGSLLLRMKPGKRAGGKTLQRVKTERVGLLADPVPVTLSEPNCLLLDQAEWRVKGGAWQPREELLKLDNLARKALGMAEREGHIAQPWSDTRPDPVKGVVELRFAINSEIEVTGAQLALEDRAVTEVLFDGNAIERTQRGWYVDESMHTIDFPAFAAGEHELILRVPLNRKRGIEWCYLLGDFGVRVSGRHAVIVPPVRTLTWGDWTTQGLPFYGGNVTYHVPLKTKAGVVLAAERFKAPLLTVDVDGNRVGPLAFDPFEVTLPAVKETLSITAYGNRSNSHGPVHLTDDRLVWFGPNAWRTSGAQFAYEYQLRPMGVLAAPVLKKEIG